MKKDEEMSEENYSHRRRIQKAELVTKDYTQAKGKLQEIKCEAKQNVCVRETTCARVSPYARGPVNTCQISMIRKSEINA